MTTEEIKKIARLARLELTDKELSQYAHQLTGILEYVRQLQEVDTTDVPITTGVTQLVNVWREDVVDECVYKDKLLAQAPEHEGSGVKVKSVF